MTATYLQRSNFCSRRRVPVSSSLHASPSLKWNPRGTAPFPNLANWVGEILISLGLLLSNWPDVQYWYSWPEVLTLYHPGYSLIHALEDCESVRNVRPIRTEVPQNGARV